MVVSLTRHERKRQENIEFSALPTLTLLTDYQIYLINHTTSIMLVQNLIQLARETTQFTIDTERDYATKAPALIQIEFIHRHSVVLLIETWHLPHSSSVLFWLLRSLLKIIFRPTNVLFSWGDSVFELSDFVNFGLFSLETIHELTTIDVQHEFKQWYNHRFPHTCGLPSFCGDTPHCTCQHRPVKNRNDPWSLQRAIAYTFQEFLDKSRTKSNWGRPMSRINIHQYSTVAKKEIKRIDEHLILYAVNDCLAVTKLMMLLDLN